MQWLEDRFGVSAAGSTVKTELLAGLATFLTMAYIIVVNPGILSAAGMDFGAVFVATILAAAIGTSIMGLWANWPVALAPGMGLNAFSRMASFWVWATRGKRHWAQYSLLAFYFSSSASPGCVNGLSIPSQNH